jgi:pSer/pThr/pTyr-binding forkhead associated (FHA) protein
MSTALAPQFAYQCRFIILNGPHKGETYNLSKEEISIGRETDNDLVFSRDTKVSRHHAKIQLQNNKLVLINLSTKNPVYLNNEEIISQELSAVNTVILGETEIKVDIKSLQLQNPAQDIQVRAERASRIKASSPRPSQQFNKIQSSQGGSKLFYIIIAILLALGFWLFSDSDKTTTRKTKVRTEDQVVKEMIASKEQLKSLERQIEDAGQNTIQYKTAQEHYIKGFRDYRNGQYSRAMSSFQAALSFYPQHELARKYYTLSKRKFDEQVQFKMIQGKRYRGKNNFRLCRSSYAGVMVMLKDPNDPIYKEAKQFYNECTLLLEGRY